MQDKTPSEFLKKKDSKLAEIIEITNLDSLNIHNDLYLSLTRSIVGQQLSVKAAATIYARFLALFGDGYPDPGIVVEMDIETLRSVGLSKQKASYIQNVAQYSLSNDIRNKDWEETTNEDIINALTSIKGVGKWTVQMLLMFTLGRNDVFPVDDLGIQQGMAKLYDLEDADKKKLKAAMIKIAQDWQPHRSTASRFIWKWKDGLKKA